MIDDLLAHIAPHPCSGCGKISSLLCDNCKYNIIQDYFDNCIVCGGLTNRPNLCKSCQVPYSRAWCVGERSGELRTLIDRYKFENARAAYRPLASLLLQRVEQLPETTIVVPIPTVASHIRARGYDHTYLVARSFARKRKLRLRCDLQRVTTAKQRDASRSQRIIQAKKAFIASKRIVPDAPYLIVDDIVTTGATLHYAADALRQAGVKEVWVAAIARQPLD